MKRWTRRWGLWLACWALVGGTIGVTANIADAHPPDRWPGQVECHRHWWNGPFKVASLIRCASHKVGIDADKAIAVGWCESRLTPGSPGDDPAGVFQHVLRYWADRARAYGFAGFSPYNARANVFVTVRMVRADGWGAWSCA